MAKKKPAANGDVLNLVVGYGTMSIGDKSARIGVTVARGLLSIAKAEKQFCEKRLACCLVMAPDGAHPDQGALKGVLDDIELEATFDVKSIRFSADEITFGLTGALGSLDVGALAKFAKKQGRLIVNDVSEIPEMDRKTASAGEKDEDDE